MPSDERANDEMPPERQHRPSIELVGFPHDVDRYLDYNDDMVAVSTDIPRLVGIREPAILDRLKTANVVVSYPDPSAYGSFGVTLKDKPDAGTWGDDLCHLFGQRFGPASDADKTALKTMFADAALPEGIVGVETEDIEFGGESERFLVGTRGVGRKLLILFLPMLANRDDLVCFRDLLCLGVTPGQGGGKETVLYSLFERSGCHESGAHDQEIPLRTVSPSAIWQRTLQSEPEGSPLLQGRTRPNAYTLPTTESGLLVVAGNFEIALLPYYDSSDKVMDCLAPVLERFDVRCNSKRKFSQLKSAVVNQYEAGTDSFPMVGDSISLMPLYRELGVTSFDDRHVLIDGETGTGKELIAKIVHQLSRRSAERYSAVNCALLSPMLAASELFGYKQGAFTGAASDKVGLIEAANGGTLFIDEIQCLDSEQRAMLLRYLETRQLRRIGDTERRPCDTRIVAATNDMKFRTREDVVASGFIQRFAHSIRVPPLRERSEDIEELLLHFIQDDFANIVDAVKKSDDGIKDWLERNCPALEIWKTHSWKNSNIRGLRNALSQWLLRRHLDSIYSESESFDLASLTPLPMALGHSGDQGADKHSRSPQTNRGRSAGVRDIGDDKMLEILREATAKSSPILSAHVYPSLKKARTKKLVYQSRTGLRDRLKAIGDSKMKEEALKLWGEIEKDEPG